MSEAPSNVGHDADGVVDEPTPVIGSLEERIAQRRRQLEDNQTAQFDVPGFEGIVKVELRIVGAKRQLAAINAHQRIHDESKKVVRFATDMLLAATVQFHSVVDDDGRTEVAEGASWRKLARAYDSTLDDTVTGPQAITRLITENGVLDLFAEWKDWMRTRGQKLATELAEGF